MKNLFTLFTLILLVSFSPNLNAQHADEAFLGVHITHYNKSKSSKGTIVNIIKNSTADEMGLEDGDIISNINGTKIKDWHSLSDEINSMEPGQKITLSYVRNGAVQEVKSVIKSYAETYQKVEDNNATDIIEKEDFTISDFKVVDITESEAVEMKETYNVEMPIVNDLRIEQLNIYPNPNNGIFNLTFNLPIQAKTSIRIYSSSAQLVYQKDIEGFQGFFQEQVDISGKASGNYFVMIAQGNKSISKRVIIQK